MDPDTVDEHQAIRRAAFREVGKQLRSPEHLQRIQKLIDHYSERRGAVATQLSLIVQHEMEEIRRGRSLLDECSPLISDLKSQVVDVEKWCTEGLVNTPSFDVLRQVYIVKRNATNMLRDLDAVASIPEELEKLSDWLRSDDDDIFPTAHLALLRLAKRVAVSTSGAMQSGDGSNVDVDTVIDDAANSVNLSVVGKTEGLFSAIADRIFKIFRDCISLAPKNPFAIIRAMQMILRQEYADNKWGEAEGVLRKRKWLREVMHEIEDSIELRFQELLRAEGELDIDHTESAVAGIVTAWNFLLDDLTCVADFVAPCFPPDQDILTFWCSQVHRRIVREVERLKGMSISPSDVVTLLGWSKQYTLGMSSIGFEPEQPLMSDSDDLINEYMKSSARLLLSWSKQVIEQDKDTEPEENPSDGLLYTPAPVELFNMVTQQISATESLNNPKLTLNVWIAGVQTLKQYAEDMAALMNSEGGELPLPLVIATVNNACSCMDNLARISDDEVTGELDIVPAEDAFVNLARAATAAISRQIAADIMPSMRNLFSQQWVSGTDDVAGTINATCSDYFSEINSVLIRNYYSRAVQGVLDVIISRYIAQLLLAPRLFSKNCAHMDDATADKLDEDALCIRRAFDGQMRDKALKKQLDVFLDLAELLRCETDDLASFQVTFAAMIKRNPDAPVLLVDIILKSRPNVEKKVRNQVTKSVDEIARQAVSINESSESDHSKAKGVFAQAVQIALQEDPKLSSKKELINTPSKDSSSSAAPKPSALSRFRFAARKAVKEESESKNSGSARRAASPPTKAQGGEEAPVFSMDDM